MSTRIYFATNRNPLPSVEDVKEFGHDFSPNGHDDLRFGQVMVEDDGSLTDLACLPNAPSEGSQSMLAELKAKMFSQGRPTFVFIHGYNTNWANACKAAASLKKAYAAFNPNVVLISWPSDGLKGPRDMKEYGYDRLDAEHSGRAVYRGLMKLYGFLASGGAPCGQKIVLFAHSMGNFVLSNAIASLVAETPPSRKLPRLFDHIISAAADEDSNAFEVAGKWARIGELCGELTVYMNKYDKALWGSDLTKGNPDRMGNGGPEKPFEIPRNVTLVDASALNPITDIVGHGYYDTWPGVVADITAVINGEEQEKIGHRQYVQAKNKYSLTK